MTRVGFIGTGHISAPMARALARHRHQVTVSRRNAEVSAALAEAGLGIAVAENQEVADASDVVFLCLRPAVWEAAATALTFRPDQQIVSVMAGVPLAEIARVCAPVTRLSVTIPYAFVEFGGCPLPVAGDAGAVTALFGPMNPVLPQNNEAAMASFFAASTMVSGALGLLETGAGWLGARTGDADSAEVYVAALVAGFLRNLDLDRAGRLSEAKWALATPRTLSRQMVEGLAFDALPDLLDRIERSMD